MMEQVLHPLLCVCVCVCVCVCICLLYVTCKTATFTHSCVPPTSRCCGKSERTFCLLRVALASDKQFVHPHTS